MSGIDRDAFLDGYLAEMEEHVGAVARDLAAIGASTGTAHPRAVRDVFRALHTIKGLSAMVGVEPIVDLAHAMEIVVRAGEKAGGRLAATAVDQLVEGVRAIAQRLRLVAERRPVTPAPPGLLAALADADPSGRPRHPPAVAAPALAIDEPALTASDREEIHQGIAAGQVCARIDVIPTPARAAAGLTITTVRERVGQVATIVRVVPKAMPRGDRAPGGLAFALYVLHGGDDDTLAAAAGVDAGDLTTLARPAAAAPGEPAGAPAGDDAPFGDDVDDAAFDMRGGRFVRVDVARLDDVLERLSALFVSRFRLARTVADLAAAGADVRDLSAVVHETHRQLRGLRAAVMRSRMVPVAELLERLPLMVRGLARATGKAAAITIDAGRAELDKVVGERLFPAIVHVIRNAVDHGIEGTDERRAAGKPAEGQIRVSCHERSGNQLELVIRDDGRGVDAEALARRAGRLVPASDDGLLELLATPGLSSRSEATTTSGRGLGVDIVLRIVRDLGGQLAVSSKPGEGTTFTMRVPLSISIVEAFSFEAAGQIFLTPVGAIEEILDVDPARTSRAPQRPGLRAEVTLLERRGGVVPLVGLGEVFALPAVVSSAAARGLLDKAIVVRRGGEPCAFRVDRVLGQQEVVVRPLVDELVKVAGVTGSTDLGDGKPVLVLDLIALADRLVDPGAVAPW
jgi:two-component system chemotaxis sensor kinase CheA